MDRARRRIRLRLLVVATIALCLPVAPADAQQGRRLRRIERPATRGPLYAGDVPLPTRASCERAVRRIAAAYRPGGELGPWLAPDFPNREELLAALERVALHATQVRLEIESIESIRVEPWRVDEAKSKPRLRHLVAECVADVRTRLSFDDPATGRRAVRSVGRAQWRLRYEREVRP
jgi:hypothetical protein